MDDLDAARRDAVHRLCVAQARHILSVESFEQRLALVHEAPTTAQVLQLVADLEATGEFELAGPVETPLPAAYGLAPESLRLSSVFAQNQRAGRWSVPALLETKVIFGELIVDFRDAWFESDEVEIDVDVSFGSLKLVVPPGTEVRNDVGEMFGGATQVMRSSHGAEANGLVVHLSGKVMFGSIEISERRSTETFPPGHFAGVKGFFNRWREGLD